MIAKIPKKRNDGKSSFRDLVEYIVGKEKKEKDQTRIIERAVYHKTRNMDFAKEDVYLAIDEMEGLGDQNIRCKDPVFHFILSYRPGEIPSHAQIDEAVDISLRELGLEKCKSIYGLQNDNGIHHIHVCVCRIDPETEKAIHPAGGWTKKALNKASRKIEISQGWEILRNDPFWEVTGDGRIVEKGKSRSDVPRLDSNAQDFEAHTGEKSAQTLAIERAAPIISAARSWQELHEKLSEVGMKFERKGSGAVIAVGDEFVKASNAGRECSLSKLEKRLGEFCNRDEMNAADGLTVSLSPEPTKQTETTEKTLSAWQKYQLYKEGYVELKDAKNSLFAEQREQRKILREQHKRKRDELYTTSWKGRGKELNLERRLLAAQQLRDKQKLLREQEADRGNLAIVPKSLSYRKWLRENQPELISDLRNWRQDKTKTPLKGPEYPEQKKATAIESPTPPIHAPVAMSAPLATPAPIPSVPAPVQIPTAEPIVVDAFSEAENIAASIVPRQNVKQAWYATPYKGVVVGNEHGIILLQTRKDEIILISADILANIPKLGEKVEIKRAKNSSSLRDVELIERDRGR